MVHFFSHKKKQKNIKTLYKTLIALALCLPDTLVAQDYEWAIKPQFYDYDVKAFSEGLASARQNQKYGFIDKWGQWIIQPQFESVESYTEGASRDKNDDFLLALAQDGQAEYLVTGDKDLLVLGSFAQTQIISLRHFTDHILPFV